MSVKCFVNLCYFNGGDNLYKENFPFSTISSPLSSHNQHRSMETVVAAEVTFPGLFKICLEALKGFLSSDSLLPLIARNLSMQEMEQQWSRKPLIHFSCTTLYKQLFILEVPSIALTNLECKKPSFRLDSRFRFEILDLECNLAKLALAFSLHLLAEIGHREHRFHLHRAHYLMPHRAF